MSEAFQRIEVITGTARRRCWTVEEKLRIAEENLQPGLSVAYVARQHGVAPDPLFRWRKLMREGGWKNGPASSSGSRKRWPRRWQNRRACSPAHR